MANRKKKGKLKLIYFLYILIIISASFFYVWQHYQVIKIGYKIDKLRIQLNDLKNKNKYLKVETNSLKSLDRIEKRAVDELKMVKPKTEDIIMLPGDN